MTGQSFWNRADSKCSAGWFDSISPRGSLSNHCLEHSDARSSGDISTMVFEWFWLMCVVIHLIKPVSGLTDWKPRKSTCVVFHSIWPLFGLTDYQSPSITGTELDHSFFDRIELTHAWVVVERQFSAVYSFIIAKLKCYMQLCVGFWCQSILTLDD